MPRDTKGSIENFREYSSGDSNAEIRVVLDTASLQDMERELNRINKRSVAQYQDYAIASNEYILERKAEYEKELDEIAKKRKETDDKKELDKLAAQEKKIREQQAKIDKLLVDDQVKWQGIAERKQARELAKEKEKLRKEAIEAEREDQIESLREQGKEFKATLLQAWTDNSKQFTDWFESGEGAANTINALSKSFKEAIDSASESYSAYIAAVNVRLQGLSKNFTDYERTINTKIGWAQPYIRIEKVLQALQESAESGVAFNIEQRAFLQAVSDNIAATFDAFDKNLTRLVRLQQADSTAARLGMEARLTSFLNKVFEDSSYLINNFDTVSQNLLEAASTMTTDFAVEFEYVIQKYLGALTSVGLSDSAVGSISQALGYLASGNIAALSSNEGMQNLIVMAASRAGIDYAKILTNGITLDDTNKLLYSIVTYMQEIANNQNYVVRSQYANIFGLDISDLTAALNLTNQDLSIIKNETLTYTNAIGELSYQMRQLPTRLGIVGMMDTLKDNLKWAMGSAIASNPIMSITYEVATLLQEVAGGIGIPGITVVGSGTTSEIKIADLINVGLIATSALMNIESFVSGISNLFDPSGMLGKFNITSKLVETTRGTGLQRRNSGLGTSAGGYVGTSGSDIYETTLAQTEEEQAKKVEEKQGDQKTTDDIYEVVERGFNSLSTLLNNKLDTSLSDFKTALIIDIYGTGGDRVIPALTSIKNTAVAIRADTASSSSVIENIESTVYGIYRLLQSGITVSVSNLGSITSGISSPINTMASNEIFNS